MPKPDPHAPKPAPAVTLDDRAIMATGIPGFGLTIPWFTGLYGALRPDDWRWWAGCAGFVALAAAIWLGNRWLLLEQRKHFDWFGNPWRKLVLLVSANVLYTAPLTAAAIALWFALAGQAQDRTTIALVVAVNVICVLFVTHAYETLFLIRERESDLLRVARLERAGVQAELAALKAQLDPHFLFNSLNTLGHLIVHDGPRAREFCDTLAEVTRYVLACRDRDLVPLADELAFVRDYHRLLALRFGAAVQIDWGDLGTAAASPLVPPLALQTLVENAVKHNRTDGAEPLVVTLRLHGDAMVVANPLLARSSARASAGVGLRNLDERCRLLTGRALGVERDAARFTVRVPLVGSAAPGSAAARPAGGAGLGAAARPAGAA